MGKFSNISYFNELLRPVLCCLEYEPAFKWEARKRTGAATCYTLVTRDYGNKSRRKWLQHGRWRTKCRSVGWWSNRETTGEKLRSNCEWLTLELMMVLWMPLSLTLMVICLSDRSGLMNGGWILTWGFFLGSDVYLHEDGQRAWIKEKCLVIQCLTGNSQDDKFAALQHKRSSTQCTITALHIKVHTTQAKGPQRNIRCKRNSFSVRESFLFQSHGTLHVLNVIFVPTWKILCFLYLMFT